MTNKLPDRKQQPVKAISKTVSEAITHTEVSLLKWNRFAKQEIRKHLNYFVNTKKQKAVLFFIFITL